MNEIGLPTGKTIKLYTPKELKAHLDEHVIGQEEAKKTLSVAIYNHFKRLFLSTTSLLCDIDKSNAIILGSTGCGKSYMIKTIAKFMGIPYYIADATSLTQAGYVGDDVESILVGLLRAANYDLKLAECGIVFIDEIDKLAKKGASEHISRDVVGEGVQQALLKILEGNVVGIPPQGGRKHPEQQLIYMNTTNILFIGSGAFSGIDKIIKKRLKINTRHLIGYNNQSLNQNDIPDDTIYEYLSQEDLRTYGLIPEFIGRFPIITNINQLTKKDLVKILKEPKNSILNQYTILFAADDISLTVDDKALEYIADIALTLKTGARGLRTLMEDVMKDFMYELPGSDKSELRITKSIVEKKLAKRYKHEKAA